jgi:magnesium-transporting ATPase (P-type)
MKRHHSKINFNIVSVTVIVFEVLAFIVFILGISLTVYNMFLLPPIFTNFGVILMLIGTIIISFLLLGFAEFLQLLMKIEVNTRKK